MRSRYARFGTIGLLKFFTPLALFIFVASVFGGSQGTRLTGNKTAAAVLKSIEKYQWNLEKGVAPTYSPSPIPIGGTGLVPFSISVTRSGPEVTRESQPIQGQICLSNTGNQPTSGLYLQDRVEKSDGTPLSAWMPIPVLAEIPAGQTVCYPYQLPLLTLDPQVDYRNHAVATLSNFEGYEGTEHSIDIYQPVAIQVETQQIDWQAELSDLVQCPAGFSCTPLTLSQLLSGSQTLEFPVTIVNQSATCGSHQLVNAASLIAVDSRTRWDASATAVIQAQLCGCAGSIGYWKNNLSEVAPVLPLYLGTPGGAKTFVVTTTTIAGNVLSFNYGGASNGIAKLYAQLLGAKIAIAKGADASPVSSIIAAADLFLATYNYLDWASLTTAQQAQVVSWASTLALYNNGQLSVPHC